MSSLLLTHLPHFNTKKNTFPYVYAIASSSYTSQVDLSREKKFLIDTYMNIVLGMNEDSVSGSSFTQRANKANNNRT